VSRQSSIEKNFVKSHSNFGDRLLRFHFFDLELFHDFRTPIFYGRMNVNKILKIDGFYELNILN